MSNNVAFPKVPVIIVLIHLFQVLVLILVISSDDMGDFLQYFQAATVLLYIDLNSSDYIGTNLDDNEITPVRHVYFTF
jgi:hypothetical protein